jgi:hypothetical protein
MYCCQCLENYVANAGQRGAAILVFRMPNGDGLRFVLQSRGVAFEDEAKVGPIASELAPVPYRINISCCGVIKHCPGCGRRLEDLVQPAKDDFFRLAQEHRKYLPKDFYQTQS